MKQLLLSLTLFIGITSFSQSMGDLTIFSNTGDQFYVVLNGIRQNNAPETNVKVTGLTNNWYSCKIVSANNNFTIDKNVVVKYDTLITYQIINKSGKYKMRYHSEAPNGSATAQTNQAVIVYHATETSDPVNTNTGSSTLTTTTTTTSSTTGMGTSTNVNDGTTGTTETININMNVSETGMNVNVNATGTDNGNMSTNSSTTTTTTSSSDGSYYEETSTTTTSSGDGTYYEETTTTTVTTTNTTGDKVIYQDQEMTATIAPMDCSFSDTDTDALIKQIEEESFSDDQQRIANMAAKKKCMHVSQIQKIAKSFTFAENKLSFLKAAYDNCPDKSDYYKLMDVLTFSGDKQELENFINTK